MTLALNILIAAFLQTSTYASSRIESQQNDQTLARVTIDLLSSFTDCIVYMYDRGYNDYNSETSTKYFQFYSESVNCAIIVDSPWLYRNKPAGNPRFDIFEPHPLFTKYTRSLLKLLSPSTTSTILTHQGTDGFFITMGWYNIPFNYVLIFMSNKEFRSIDSIDMFSKLVRISSPAVYMLVLDGNEVNIIGFAHALQYIPFLFRVETFEEGYIRKFHELTHKDLLGAVARIWVWESWETCPFRTPVRMHPHYCTIHVMAENFNITFLNEIEHPFTTPSISEITVRLAINSLFWRPLTRRTKFNFNFVTSSLDYQVCNFICIAKVNTIGLMAFANGYDMLTWIVMATACFCMSVTIAAMSGRTTKPFWTKIQSSVPVVMMLLIERFYGYGQVIRSASRQIVLVITLWAFGAMLLGMCYSGNMVSQLTSPTLPSYPHGMQELAEVEDYPVWSDTICVVDGAKTAFFHSQIHDYLTNYAPTNDSLAISLRKLSSTLNYVNFSSLTFPSSNNTSSKLSFAYAGRTDQTDAYRMWSIIHSNKTFVVGGGDLPFFNAWAPILIQTNFLEPIFQRFLANFLRCGVWNYWMKGWIAFIANDYFSIYVRKNEIEFGEMWFRKANLASIWHSSKLLIEDTTSWNAIALEDLKAAFLLLGTCLLLSLCVIFMELFPMQLVIQMVLNSIHNASMAINRAVSNLAVFCHMSGNRATSIIQPKSG